MIIEVRRDYVEVDGERLNKSDIFEITKLGGEKSTSYEYKIDFRDNYLSDKDITILNKSGHNLTLIGINDWKASINTSQGIVIRQGHMEYMSQYNI